MGVGVRRRQGRQEESRLLKRLLPQAIQTQALWEILGGTVEYISELSHQKGMEVG